MIFFCDQYNRFAFTRKYFCILAILIAIPNTLLGQERLVIRHELTPEGNIARARADALLTQKLAQLVGERVAAERLDNMVKECDVAYYKKLKRTFDPIAFNQQLAEVRSQLQKKAMMQHSRVGITTKEMNTLLEEFSHRAIDKKHGLAMTAELSPDQMDAIYLTDGSNAFSARTGKTRLEAFTWPFLLQSKDFQGERDQFEKVCDNAIKEMDSTGSPSPDTVIDLLKAVVAITNKVDTLPQSNDQDVRMVEGKWRKEAKEFLRQLKRTIADCSKLNSKRLSTYVFEGKTLGELIEHMEVKGLQFSEPSEQDNNFYASIYFAMRYAYEDKGTPFNEKTAVVSNTVPNATVTNEPSDASSAPTSENSTVTQDVKATVVNLANGVKMEFVHVPAGSFMMGDANRNPDERPVHKVTITKPFRLGKYEVTQRQWQAVMGNNPSRFKGLQNPVDSVSWDDCQEFIRKLNSKFAQPSERFSLPTEAQWEYACRAGSSAIYCCGDNKQQWGEYAWCDENSENKVHPVGQKKPNAFGLYDMHGNAWEWCADWYGSNYYAVSPTDDPTGPASGSERVFCGGAWGDHIRDCGSGIRNRRPPGDSSVASLSFRVMLVP